MEFELRGSYWGLWTQAVNLFDFARTTAARSKLLAKSELDTNIAAGTPCMLYMCAAQHNRIMHK